MSALFPDVPVTAGVPPVLRQVGSYIDAEVSTLNAQSNDALSPPVWGIYGPSGVVLEPDNIRALGFVGEYRIADYPIEDGDFRSYNKVRLPFAIRIAMTKGGSSADRVDFITALETLRRSLDLVDVVTPEATYIDLNVTRVSYDRSAESGAGLLMVEVVLEEVRQTAVVEYSQAKAAPGSSAATGTAVTAPSTPAVKPIAAGTTKSPASASKANRGSVQAVRDLSAAIGSSPRIVRDGSGTSYVFDLKTGAGK